MPPNKTPSPEDVVEVTIYKVNMDGDGRAVSVDLALWKRVGTQPTIKTVSV